MADTPIAPTPVGSWPTAPQRTDAPATFVTRADAWVAATPTRSTEMNALATNVNYNAESAFDSAAEALVSAQNSEASELIAVGIANYAGEWSTLSGAKTVPLSVDHEGVFWILLADVADVTAEEPGVSASWGRAYGAGQIEERTSNVLLTAFDNGKIIKVTSNTFTQTIDTAANCGANWSLNYYNAGTGTITIDPSGAELIDGASTITLYTGEIVFISCTGTAFKTIKTYSTPEESEVTVTTGNGYGSTNTKVRRFGAVLSSSGTAITYEDSAADGGSLTINKPGQYEVCTQDTGTGATTLYGFGVSVNSAELTTNIESITAANRILFGTAYNISGASDSANPITRTVRFAAGDVVRAHNGGANLPNSTTAAYTKFSIRRVGP